MDELVAERARFIAAIDKFELDEDDDMKRVLRQLREKKRYLDRLIYLRGIIEAKNTQFEDFKAESPNEYDQLKRIDDSVDRKTLKQLRLMKKVLTKEYLTADEKKLIFSEISDD